MTDFIRQIRIALRGLARTPAFTASAILILGFGIGTAAAMFTVFRAVLVERLPVNDADRLVVFSTYKDPAVEFGLQRKDLREIARSSRTLSAVGGYAHYGAFPAPYVDGERSIVMNRAVVTGD